MSSSSAFEGIISFKASCAQVHVCVCVSVCVWMHGPVVWRSPGVTSQPSMLLFLPYGAGALAMERHKQTMPEASEEVWQERLRGEQVWVLGLNYEGAQSGDRSSDNLPNCRLRPVNRRERVPGRDSPLCQSRKPRLATKASTTRKCYPPHTAQQRAPRMPGRRRCRLMVMF